MDFRDRLSEIFKGNSPDLRTIFDCDSNQWHNTTVEKKIDCLQKMLDSGYPVEKWIEDYKEHYKKTHPHILSAIDKSVTFIREKEKIKRIAAILKPYMVNLDIQLNQYSDFKGLDIELLTEGGFFYTSPDRKLHFVDSLRSYLNSDNIHDENYAIKFWIINRWGGISSFKDNKERVVNSNRQKIDNFLQRTKQRKNLTKPLFEVISSLSKVTSFSDSSRFFVYDSRVIYSLNWLLLKNDIKEVKFFPMPQGRNAKLSFFDLDTIIKLKKKIDYTGLEVSDLYFQYTDAYYIYCDLIRELAQELIPDKPAYYLEMFLFTMVDIVYEEIREIVDISLNKTPVK